MCRSICSCEQMVVQDPSPSEKMALRLSAQRARGRTPPTARACAPAAFVIAPPQAPRNDASGERGCFAADLQHVAGRSHYGYSRDVPQEGNKETRHSAEPKACDFSTASSSKQQLQRARKVGATLMNTSGGACLTSARLTTVPDPRLHLPPAADGTRTDACGGPFPTTRNLGSPAPCLKALELRGEGKPVFGETRREQAHWEAGTHAGEPGAATDLSSPRVLPASPPHVPARSAFPFPKCTPRPRAPAQRKPTPPRWPAVAFLGRGSPT